MTSKISSYFHLSGSHRLAGCFAVAALTGCAPDFNFDDCQFQGCGTRTEVNLGGFLSGQVGS
jgi:hypothetical protein